MQMMWSCWLHWLVTSDRISTSTSEAMVLREEILSQVEESKYLEDLVLEWDRCGVCSNADSAPIRWGEQS